MVYIDTDIYGFDLDRALGCLPEQRRQQALRIRHEEGRRLCVMAYRLLQEALLREFGISERPTFGYAPGGKPFIIGHEDIHFNLSHCRGGAACGVARQPIGIDMETVRPFNEALARYVLSDSEYHMVTGSEQPAESFIHLWTQKEALGKLHGRGLRGSIGKGKDMDDGGRQHEDEVCTVALAPPLTGRLSLEEIRGRSLRSPLSPTSSSASSHLLYLSVCLGAR